MFYTHISCVCRFLFAWLTTMDLVPCKCTWAACQEHAHHLQYPKHISFTSTNHNVANNWRPLFSGFHAVRTADVSATIKIISRCRWTNSRGLKLLSCIHDRSIDRTCTDKRLRAIIPSRKHWTRTNASCTIRKASVHKRTRADAWAVHVVLRGVLLSSFPAKYRKVEHCEPPHFTVVG